MSDLGYSAMSQEQLLHVVQDKDAEIERLREYNDTLETLNQAAKDESKRKTAEIERLREDLGVVDAWRNKVIAENTKLQAVVDAAREYISDHHNDSEQELFDALAAWETDDEQRQ